MPCRLSKSSFLVFYFAKNRDDDFYLHTPALDNISLTVTSIFLSRARVYFAPYFLFFSSIPSTRLLFLMAKSFHDLKCVASVAGRLICMKWQ